LQSRKLTIHWIVLAFLSLVVLAGALAAHVSSTPAVVAMALTKNETARISVFRLFPDVTRVVLVFERAPGQERPELGSFASKRGSGWVEFASPGAPVIVRLRDPSSEVEYEALPAIAYAPQRVSRELVVRAHDGNPNRFAWPPEQAIPQVLSPGWSTLELTVVGSGEAIAGEVVQAVVVPPIMVKSARHGYEFLWWFALWPLFVVPLACYGAVLSWQTWRSRRPGGG
jgi:hypothetical protein